MRPAAGLESIFIIRPGESSRLLKHRPWPLSGYVMQGECTALHSPGGPASVLAARVDLWFGGRLARLTELLFLFLAQTICQKYGNRNWKEERREEQEEENEEDDREEE